MSTDTPRRVDSRSLKERVDLRSIIPPTHRRRDGHSYSTDLCPFHDDHNPSFLIYPTHYLCMACGEKGDVFDWYKKMEGLGFREALGRVGEAPISIRVKKKREYRRPAMSMVERYEKNLSGAPLLQLKNWRGITPFTAAAHHLGYGRDEEAFTIPLYDEEGKLVDIKYRKNPPYHIEGPRYWHIRDCDNTHLYGSHHLSQSALPTFGYLSGELDAILFWQVTGLVGTSSSSGEGHFNPMWGKWWVGRINIWIPDNDETGERALVRDVPEAVKRGRIVVRPPSGVKDFTEWVMKDGETTVRTAIWSNLPTTLRLPSVRGL